MQLIIDIGNTCAKLYVFDGSQIIRQEIVPNDSLRGLADLASRYTFEAGIYATVIHLSCTALQQLHSLPFPMLPFTHSTPIPISNAYHAPHQLGTDRLAAVVGAVAQYPRQALLVIDAGTCITYEQVSPQGRYAGGNIAPGMQMRLQALHHYTSALPLISPEGDVPSMGYDTRTAIRAGVLRGICHEICGYIGQTANQYTTLRVVLTGGDLPYLPQRVILDAAKLYHCTIVTDQYLVARGLNYILHQHEKK